MKVFKVIIVLIIFLFAVGQRTKAQSDVSVIIEPYAIPSLPGLHSFAAAQYNGKWILIGGRTDGLHLRQPNAAFASANANAIIYVVDPISKNIWTAPVSSLPAAINEQLQSTNMLFCQDANSFYIAGGYGYSASSNNHKTYASLLIIDLPGLVDAVTNGTSIVSFFRQLNNDLFALTGGQFAKLGETFLMVGGHRFDGTYNPNNGPSFTQVYSNQMRIFKLADDGTIASISYQNALTDVNEFHRRDYNMVPQVFPDGKLGYTAFSGVFKIGQNLPFLQSVDIDTIGYTPNAVFNQQLNHYHSGKLAVYDAAANLMHNIFLGGMAQFYYDAGGNLQQDNEVPFVNTVGKVTRNGTGDMTETKIAEMPGLLGSGAEFFPNHDLPVYANDVIRLNDITQDTVLAGYLVGGIQSLAPNIFFINTGLQSNASNTVYKIFLVKDAGTIPVRMSYFRGRKMSKSVLLEWKTVSEHNSSHFELQRSINGNEYTTITTITATGENTGSNYSYTDDQPNTGMNYYRLKQVDRDGKFTYSAIILIHYEITETGYVFYPNPVKEKLVLEFAQQVPGRLMVKIMDVNGSLVYDQVINTLSRQVNIHTASLLPGTYILQVEVNNKTYTDKFIKE